MDDPWDCTVCLVVSSLPLELDAAGLVQGLWMMTFAAGDCRATDWYQGLDRPREFAWIPPRNGPAIVEFAGANPWQSTVVLDPRAKCWGSPGRDSCHAVTTKSSPWVLPGLSSPAGEAPCQVAAGWCCPELSC